jgi:hypothetical protein
MSRDCGGLATNKRAPIHEITLNTTKRFRAVSCEFVVHVFARSLKRKNKRTTIHEITLNSTRRFRAVSCEFVDHVFGTNLETAITEDCHLEQRQ